MMYNTCYHGFVRKRKEDAPTGGFGLASLDGVCSETPDQEILNYKGCNSKPLGYQEQVDGVPWDRLPDDRKVEIGRNALKELIISVCEKILALAAT